MEATAVLLIRCNTHYERCSLLPVRVQIGSNVLNALSCTKEKKNHFHFRSMITLCQIINKSAAGLLSKIQRCNQRTANDRNPPKKQRSGGKQPVTHFRAAKEKDPLNPPKTKEHYARVSGLIHNYHSYLHLHFPAPPTAHPACILRGGGGGGGARGGRVGRIRSRLTERRDS